MTGPTEITPAPPYAPGVVSHYLVVSTIATLGTPTLTELQAGTDITKDVAAVNGFTKTPNSTTVDRMGYGTKPKLTDGASWDDTSLVMGAASDGSDQRSLFTVGTATHVVRVEGALTSGSVMHVYAVTPSYISQPNQTSGDAQYTVGLDISDAAEDLSWPAS